MLVKLQIMGKDFWVYMYERIFFYLTFEITGKKRKSTNVTCGVNASLSHEIAFHSTSVASSFVVLFEKCAHGCIWRWCETVGFTDFVGNPNVFFTAASKTRHRVDIDIAYCFSLDVSYRLESRCLKSRLMECHQSRKIVWWLEENQSDGIFKIIFDRIVIDSFT